jgi:hypothetical protein
MRYSQSDSISALCAPQRPEIFWAIFQRPIDVNSIKKIRDIGTTCVIYLFIVRRTPATEAAYVTIIIFK